MNRFTKSSVRHRRPHGSRSKSECSRTPAAPWVGDLLAASATARAGDQTRAASLAYAPDHGAGPDGEPVRPLRRRGGWAPAPPSAPMLRSEAREDQQACTAAATQRRQLVVQSRAPGRGTGAGRRCGARRGRGSASSTRAGRCCTRRRRHPWCAAPRRWPGCRCPGGAGRDRRGRGRVRGARSARRCASPRAECRAAAG
jgi:hypothetical protein